jgi:pimeloyl-ACP methyl ester carboxylesterase
MGKSIELAQGTIHYRDEGEGPALLFVHGLLVDGRLWREVTPALAERYRCVVGDWPLGAHMTPLAAGADRSPRGIAHLIADFIERLGLEDVTVVANDTGGAISQILVTERPEHIAALVLTNCDCYENFLPPIFRPLQWLAHVPGAYWLIARSLRSARLRRSKIGFGMLSRKAIPDQLTEAWATQLAERSIRADVVATLKAIDSRDTLAAARRLSESPLPLLLAWAPEDLAFPLRFAQRLHEAVAGSRIELIEQSRAFVPVDQPARLAELIDGFAAGVASGRPAAAQST